MKVRVENSIIDYYTDVLCHCYEPDGDKLAIGTSNGKLIVLGNDENGEMNYLVELDLPEKSAVLGLHWSTKGIIVGAKSLLYMIRSEDIQGRTESDFSAVPFVKFECMSNVYDVCSQSPSDNKVFGACDDSKIRVWDVETLQQICELTDHRSVVEVCNASNEFLVSGSQDGKIHVYESSLRTKKSVISFDVGKQVVSGLDIDQNSTWVAAGCKGSPIIYNLRNVASLPEIEVEKSQKIYTVHFDKRSNLWWAGGCGFVYRSADLTGLSVKLKSTYGNSSIHHVYSITSNPSCVSVAGSSTGILFTENGDYWEEMVHVGQ